MKYKIVYFGSSTHSLPSLEGLHNDDRFEVVGIVTQPDKPVGRKQLVTPTPVSAWAKEHGVELLTPNSWKKDVAVLDRLKELNADAGVLAIYGKILPQSVIDVFPKGIVNIHPSILPKYRGPAPAAGVILAGEAVSGVTIMLLVQEMDAGPVLACEEFEMIGNEIPDAYYDKSFKLGNDLLMTILPRYLSGEMEPTEQDHSQATYTHMLNRDHGKIDWKASPEEIERLVRAYTPWPGTWTDVWVRYEDGTILLEKEMRERLGLLADTTEWEGVARKRMKVLSVVLEGGVLHLDQVQLEGEKPQSFSKLI